MPGAFRPLTQVTRARSRDVPQEWVDQRFYSIVTDLVGTPTELIDDQGNLAWHSRTTVWGQQLGRITGNTDIPLRFPGQYHDPESELNYNYHRHYDPGTGRYMSNDPLGVGACRQPPGLRRESHLVAGSMGTGSLQHLPRHAGRSPGRGL